jgi:hypothetical protein
MAKMYLEVTKRVFPRAQQHSCYYQVILGNFLRNYREESSLHVSLQKNTRYFDQKLFASSEI